MCVVCVNCRKLFIGLFVNTAIILLLVNASFNYYVADMGFTIALDGSYDGKLDEQRARMIIQFN